MSVAFTFAYTLPYPADIRFKYKTIIILPNKIAREEGKGGRGRGRGDKGRNDDGLLVGMG
jgi:hypothetical protein